MYGDCPVGWLDRLLLYVVHFGGALLRELYLGGEPLGVTVVEAGSACVTVVW